MRILERWVLVATQSRECVALRRRRRLPHAIHAGTHVHAPRHRAGVETSLELDPISRRGELLAKGDSRGPALLHSDVEILFIGGRVSTVACALVELPLWRRHGRRRRERRWRPVRRRACRRRGGRTRRRPRRRRRRVLEPARAVAPPLGPPRLRPAAGGALPHDHRAEEQAPPGDHHERRQPPPPRFGMNYGSPLLDLLWAAVPCRIPGL